MQTIYEFSPEYTEAFTTTNKMVERIRELNNLEGEQRLALAEGPKRTEGATPQALALQVLHGEHTDNSPGAEFERKRQEFGKTKVDLEILQRGMIGQHEALRILHGRVSAKRMKAEDVRRVVDKVAKAARDFATAQKAMQKLCDEVTAVGFESSSDAMLFNIEPNVTAVDALEVYAERLREFAGLDKS